MNSKFVDKSAQKSSVLSSKASYARSLFLYLTAAGFVLGWWVLAFPTKSSELKGGDQAEQPALTLQTSDLLDYLSPLQRDSLHQALAGNTRLMIELMTKWEQDAQVLSKKGVLGIQKLNEEAYLQAHLLARLIQESSSDQLDILNRRLRSKSLQDDAGNILLIKDSFNRFLPQTFVAASFLLAIARPQEILALPIGLRDLPQLYHSCVLDSIPGRSDRYRGEKLYLARPDLAFIAHYSHPPTLEMLRNQGIQLCTIKNIDSVKDIQEALLKVGHASNHPLEANLLSIFIDASFLAIDNRLRAIEQLNGSPHSLKQVLYLYHHHHYLMPTTKSLTGQLLERALSRCPSLACPIASSETEWRLPFEQEKILNNNPDCLILSIPASATGFKDWMEAHKIFRQLNAFRTGRIFYVDETVQESPTQYIVLAYFDIFQALATARCL